jgi:hypothetical protein
VLVLFVTYVVGLGGRAVADGATGLLGEESRRDRSRRPAVAAPPSTTVAADPAG